MPVKIQRMASDMKASQTLVAANTAQFNEDRGKLTLDIALFSLVAYFETLQFDWQVKRVHFKTSTGTTIMTQPGSKPDDCSEISKADLRKMLQEAGNPFADTNTFLGQNRLCLPPESTVRVAPLTLTITNPFCEIAFRLKTPNSVTYLQPKSGGRSTLPNGEAKFETRPIGIEVTTTFSWIRAQHRQMAKYQDWTQRITTGAQEWFESTENESDWTF